MRTFDQLIELVAFVVFRLLLRSLHCFADGADLCTPAEPVPISPPKKSTSKMPAHALANSGVIPSSFWVLKPKLWAMISAKTSKAAR